MILQKHQEFITKAVSVLQQDSRICGIALCGSFTTGTMDEYSDLDFMIAVEPESFEQILGARVTIAGKLGDLLSAFTGEHIGVPDLLICLYDAPLLHPRGVRHLERIAPDFMPLLLKTVPIYGADSCIRALKEEIQLYKELRKPHEEEIVLRTRAEERSTAYLDDIRIC